MSQSALSVASPIRTVVVDAGHGGHDPGASRHGLLEKQLALDIAKRVRSHLQGAGLAVVMTRDSDRFVTLADRAATASRVGGDLLISIHLNANRSKWVSGAEVYYARESAVGSGVGWPPYIALSEIAIPSTTMQRILWDMVLGRSRSHSRRIASKVCNAMSDGLQVKCKVKSARFIVLRKSSVPAVLVEVGYVSNPSESTRLNNAQYREVAARAVASGVVSFIRSMRNQSI